MYRAERRAEDQSTYFNSYLTSTDPNTHYPEIQLAETLASGEAASLVEEGLWDMAREVVRAYEAGEMPKGSEGGFLWLCV